MTDTPSKRKTTTKKLKSAAEIASEKTEQMPSKIAGADLVPKTEEEITAPIKYMPIETFRSLGFLQEINRQILHPCGLALVVADDKIIGILDKTDDPEGIIFETVSAQKAWQVETLIKDGSKQRRNILKYDIQPAYPKLTKADIKPGKIFRAKNPKYCTGLGLNDRVVLSVQGNKVQYNSYEVPIGTTYPTIKMDAFLGWAKFEVTE